MGIVGSEGVLCVLSDSVKIGLQFLSGLDCSITIGLKDTDTSVGGGNLSGIHFNPG